MERKLSIILPVYNEKESLEVMVRLLHSTLKLTFEILIVHDTLEDNSIPIANLLSKEFSNIKLVYNKKGRGVKNAIDSGIEVSSYNIILINAVDEIFPIIAIENMINLIVEKNYDFVSGTRYSKGGLRLGGSFLGGFLSKFGNKLFQFLTNIPLSDCTTGIKMMKKCVWNKVNFTSKPIGWAFSFELSIRVWLLSYKITDFPLKSVDRLFGGSSTFKPIPWILEYGKCFIWGLKKAKIFNIKKINDKKN